MSGRKGVILVFSLIFLEQLKLSPNWVFLKHTYPKNIVLAFAFRVAKIFQNFPSFDKAYIANRVMFQLLCKALSDLAYNFSPSHSLLLLLLLSRFSRV